MLSPLTYQAINRINQAAQQPARMEEDPAASVGRADTEAAQIDPNSLHKMLPVIGKDESEKTQQRTDDLPRECQTCKNRRYQDGSDDPGVSFKTPGKIDPDVAAATVRGHEQEHVTRNQAKAEREGRKVVSQTVILHTSICPECGRVYVSGGTTKTVTAADLEEQEKERNRKYLLLSSEEQEALKGSGLDLTV